MLRNKKYILGGKLNQMIVYEPQEIVNGVIQTFAIFEGSNLDFFLIYSTSKGISSMLNI